MFGITKRPVRLSAQERATLARNAANRAELKALQYDIETTVDGRTFVDHYLRTGNGLIHSSVTKDVQEYRN